MGHWKALLLVLLGWVAAGQGARPIGVVTAVDRQTKRLTLKTDAGPEMGIETLETTRVVRVAPGSLDLNAAAKITFADVSAGDRVLVRGRSAGEGKAFAADLIVVMSKEDLAKKQEAERADWERRGIAGVVTAIDAGARAVTLRTGGGKAVVLQAPAAAKLRRYTTDSIRFSDAKPARLEDLKIGDQVKARGQAGGEGGPFLVEEMVSGSFRSFAATIAAVDAAHGTLQVLELAGKNRIEARLLPESVLRRLSPPIVKALQARSAGAKDEQSGRELQAMIEGLPPLQISDLRPGEDVVLSGTWGNDPAKLTAITVLSGVDVLLKPPSRGAKAADVGSWNLDLNMGVGAP